MNTIEQLTQFLDATGKDHRWMQKKTVQDELSLVGRYKKWAYANSWSIGNQDNYALLKVYLNGHKEGVAICTTIKRLRDTLTHDAEILKNKAPIYIKKVS